MAPADHIKHTAGPVCAECELKLASAHPYMVYWFHRRKAQHPDLHVSWAFRDQATQDDLYHRGLTRREWPTSKHNFMKDGKPCSFALDLFFIDHGIAVFPWPRYQLISEDSKAEMSPVLWGHDFKFHKEDGDHFEFTDPPHFDWEAA